MSFHGGASAKLETLTEEKALAAQQLVPWIPPCAGILAEFNGDEMAAPEVNREMLVAAASRGVAPEVCVYSFVQGPKS